MNELVAHRTANRIELGEVRGHYRTNNHDEIEAFTSPPRTPTAMAARQAAHRARNLRRMEEIQRQREAELIEVFGSMDAYLDYKIAQEDKRRRLRF